MMISSSFMFRRKDDHSQEQFETTFIFSSCPRFSSDAGLFYTLTIKCQIKIQRHRDWLIRQTIAKKIDFKSLSDPAMILTRVSVVLQKKALYLTKIPRFVLGSRRDIKCTRPKANQKTNEGKRYKTSPEKKELSPSSLCHFLCVSQDLCLFHHQKERVWCNLLEAWFVREKRKLLPESCKERNERQRIKSKKGRRSSKWFSPSRSFSRHSSVVAEKREEVEMYGMNLDERVKSIQVTKVFPHKIGFSFLLHLNQRETRERKEWMRKKRDTRRKEMRMLFAPSLLLLQLNSIRILLFFDPFFSSPLIFFPISFTSNIEMKEAHDSSRAAGHSIDIKFETTYTWREFSSSSSAASNIQIIIMMPESTDFLVRNLWRKMMLMVCKAVSSSLDDVSNLSTTSKVVNVLTNYCPGMSFFLFMSSSGLTRVRKQLSNTFSGIQPLLEPLTGMMLTPSFSLSLTLLFFTQSFQRWKNWMENDWFSWTCNWLMTVRNEVCIKSRDVEGDSWTWKWCQKRSRILSSLLSCFKCQRRLWLPRKKRREYFAWKSGWTGENNTKQTWTTWTHEKGIERERECINYLLFILKVKKKGNNNHNEIRMQTKHRKTRDTLSLRTWDMKRQEEDDLEGDDDRHEKREGLVYPLIIIFSRGKRRRREGAGLSFQDKKRTQEKKEANVTTFGDINVAETTATFEEHKENANQGRRERRSQEMLSRLIWSRNKMQDHDADQNQEKEIHDE